MFDLLCSLRTVNERRADEDADASDQGEPVVVAQACGHGLSEGGENGEESCANFSAENAK